MIFSSTKKINIFQNYISIATLLQKQHFVAEETLSSSITLLAILAECILFYVICMRSCQP